MSERRVSQVVVEVELDGIAQRRVSQVVVEVELDGIAQRRVSQLILEVDLDETVIPPEPVATQTQATRTPFWGRF